MLMSQSNSLQRDKIIISFWLLQLEIHIRIFLKTIFYLLKGIIKEIRRKIIINNYMINTK
jgi:hypothetical protein